jgi:hypothetical protein
MAKLKPQSETPATVPVADTPTVAESPPPDAPASAPTSGGNPLQDSPAGDAGATPQPVAGEFIPGTTSGIPPAEPKRPRGRPPGSKTRKINPEPPPEITGGPRGGPVDYQAIGGAICDTIVGVCAGVIGPVWNYAGPEERRNLVSATANYMRAKNMPDIPPGWLLVIAISAFALPRLNHPQTINAIAKVKSKVTGAFQRG